MDYKSRLRSILIFLIPRYPLFQVLSFLMFLGERAKINSTPPFEPLVIYVYVSLMFLTTLGMALRPSKFSSAIFASLLLILLCFLFYNNESLHYHLWLKVRICQSTFSSAWTLLLFAYFSHNKPRPGWLKRSLEGGVCIILFLEFSILWYSGQDKAAFDHLISPSPIIFYTYITFIAAITLSYYNQLYTYECTFLMAGLYFFKMCFVTLNISYWCGQKNVDYWVQLRMVGDGVFFIIGIIFYLVSFIRVAKDTSKSE